MNALTKFKTTTPPLLLPLVVACFRLAPMAQAAGPDTEGSIPGSNNGEGVGVLVSRTTGVWNTGTGFEALNKLTAGNQNTANGVGALLNNATGNNNTALGYGAGNNVTTADNVIAIGAQVVGENVSNTCYIGNIFGVTSAGATAVYVNSLGKLGTVVSSRRF